MCCGDQLNRPPKPDLPPSALLTLRTSWRVAAEAGFSLTSLAAADRSASTSEQALFRWLLPDPVAALCNGNDPDWRRYIYGAKERRIWQIIGEILINVPERVLG
jgi:hypothetical protein